MTGFDVVREIGPTQMPAVVFVTAYDAFAARAFETHALDYLVKPVTQQRFRTAIARVLERRRDREAVVLAERLSRMLAEQQGGRASISVPTPSGLVVVDTADIDWIEADDYYAVIHTRGKRLLIRESLASFEERLDAARFIRVHRSAIVSLGNVQELRTTLAGAALILRDGTKVAVSRRRKEAVETALRRRA
jgi:two-component system LytT family response regulator